MVNISIFQRLWNLLIIFNNYSSKLFSSWEKSYISKGLLALCVGSMYFVCYPFHVIYASYHVTIFFFNIWIYHNYMFFMTNCLHLFDTINSIAVDIFFSGHTARLVES